MNRTCKAEHISFFQAVSWAERHGLQMNSVANENKTHHLPFSLLPTAIPKTEFRRAVELAPLFNLLVDRIACDRNWLIETLQPTFISDKFTERLALLLKVDNCMCI
jgi:hypothetical protein